MHDCASPVGTTNCLCCELLHRLQSGLQTPYAPCAPLVAVPVGLVQPVHALVPHHEAVQVEAWWLVTAGRKGQGDARTSASVAWCETHYQLDGTSCPAAGSTTPLPCEAQSADMWRRSARTQQLHLPLSHLH